MDTYQIGKRLDDIIELPDIELIKLSSRLQEIVEQTEIPRQRIEAQRLLGHIAFEVGQRLDGTAE